MLCNAVVLHLFVSTLLSTVQSRVLVNCPPRHPPFRCPVLVAVALEVLGSSPSPLYCTCPYCISLIPRLPATPRQSPKREANSNCNFNSNSNSKSKNLAALGIGSLALACMEMHQSSTGRKYGLPSFTSLITSPGPLLFPFLLLPTSGPAPFRLSPRVGGGVG